MPTVEKILADLKQLIIYVVIFLFPLFFLPITQEFFLTNKFYLITVAAAFLILISTLELVISKKLVWRKSNLDNATLLFIIAVFLSVLISSPNKIEAVFNVDFGLVGVVSLGILSYYLSRFAKKEKILQLLNISALFVSLSVIIFFFQPLKSVNLPNTLSFLKTPLFNPVGGVINVAIFLGFIIVYNFVSLEKEEGKKLLKKHLGNVIITVFALVALFLTLYFVFGRKTTASLVLPPFDISWYAAVEILKHPLTALFGVGLDNFSSVFTRVKDIAYNQSKLWNINAFNLSASAILQIFTEAGVLGLVSFLLLISNAWSSLSKNKKLRWVFIYTLLSLLLFPISIVSLFLFFVIIGLESKKGEKTETNLKEFIPVYVVIIVIGLSVPLASLYFVGKNYLAEMYFKKALDGAAANNIKTLYDNERRAVLLAPYMERYRIDFSQTNLLIANNIAAKAKPQKGKKASKLSAQDRQTISQAIQAAIAEAKSAVALNSKKAANWANLAQVYRSMLNVAQGADVWAVSAYQRAIVEDPQNPFYRLNLGGVYFALGKWDDAIQTLSQAVYVKPDWANAHYNLAWAYFNAGKYQKAVNEMQMTLNLINPKKDKADYDKAKKELEMFKSKLPKNSKQTSEGNKVEKPKELTIPTPPVATISPKIKLPKESSPGSVVNK